MSALDISLEDCTVTEREDGGSRWTHKSGAYAEMVHDDSPHHPLDDVEGVALAFHEDCHYKGTADDFPRYLAIECPTCKGTGESDRCIMRRGYSGPIIGAGSEEAMLAFQALAIEQRDYGTVIYAVDCPTCDDGEVSCDIETYFRVDRGARAIYEFNTGNHGEASAVMYVTDDDWTDPEGAAKAWGEEYQSWAEGDVWGIRTGGPGVQSESVWGFIGREYAESAVLNEFLRPAIEAAVTEASESA